MATRVGGATISQVGALQEARKSLELEVGFPISTHIGKDLRLWAFPRTDADRERLKSIPRWSGFLVEIRETPESP